MQCGWPLPSPVVWAGALPCGGRGGTIFLKGRLEDFFFGAHGGCKMNINNVNFDAVESANKYVRKNETTDTVGSAHSQAHNQSPDLNADEINELVTKLNDGVRNIHERMSFSFHEKTQRIIVKFINADTNETVREIPPKDAIKILEQIQDFLGIIVDESR